MPNAATGPDTPERSGATPLAPGLYVVATPIGNAGDLTPRAADVLSRADVVLAEDTRRAGLLFARQGLARSAGRKGFFSLHDHNEEGRVPQVLAMIAAGQAVALVSDAGTPVLSDPGYRLVRACRQGGLHGLTDEERQVAYGADITYGTNNEFGFDYLRDNMKFYKESLVQRPLNYAIVDEVDSILIDEARTPLIISGQAEDSSTLYARINAFIPMLRKETDFTIDEKARTVLLTEDGVARMTTDTFPKLAWGSLATKSGEVRVLGMLPCVDVTGYEAALSLNRLEYHVGTGKYFKMGALGDTVDIRLAGETLAPRPGCVKPAAPEAKP